MTSDEEYLAPPVRDETLQEIMEGESWVPLSRVSSPPPPPLSAVEYYGDGWSSMDYSCCAKNRESTGVQTDAALVELPPSSSEGSSSDSVSTPRENASPIPIPPPVVARANRLRTVLDLSVSRQRAVRSKGRIDEEHNDRRYIRRGFFDGLDRYAPSTKDAIRNWRKARRDAGMSCSDSSESSSSGRSSRRFVDRISSRRTREVGGDGGDDSDAGGHDVRSVGSNQSGSGPRHRGPQGSPYIRVRGRKNGVKV